MFDKIDKGLKVLSFLTLMLIILGNIYLFFYYQEFKINIYEYINISEILSLFIPNILKILLILCTPFIIFIVSITAYINRMNRKKKAIGNSFGKKRYAYKKLERMFSGICLIMIGINIALDQINSIFFNRNNYHLNFVSHVILTISICSLVIWYLYKDWKKEFKTHIKIYFLITIIIESYITLQEFGSYQAVQFKLNEYNGVLTKLRFKDTSLILNNYRIIGQSKQYLFVYKMDSKERTYIFDRNSIVYPIETEYNISYFPWKR